MNSHAENFICSRSALTLGGGGYDEKVVTGGQSWWLHKDTRHSDQAPIAVGEIPVFLQVDSLVSSRRGFGRVFTRVPGPSTLGHCPNLPVNLHQRKACGIC